MLLPRIIPCLLIKDGGLVKTRQFGEPKYVGDPINAVRIFNEKQVDELIVLDIDASTHNKEPDLNMISDLASECRMPLCYGGGIKTTKHIRDIIELGVEKVSLSSEAIRNPDLISRGASYVGNQSIVVTLDVKRKLFGKHRVFIHNGQVDTGSDPIDLVRQFQDLGAGEIVINSINNDGMMKGYDLDLIDAVKDAIGVPLSVLGGAGSLEHIGELIFKHGTVGACAGSLFIFKGVFRAVLISYPDAQEKRALFDEHYLASVRAN